MDYYKHILIPTLACVAEDGLSTLVLVVVVAVLLVLPPDAALTDVCLSTVTFLSLAGLATVTWDLVTRLAAGSATVIYTHTKPMFRL